MTNLLKNTLYIIIAFSLASCVTNKKLNYLQSQANLKDTTTYTPSTPNLYKLKTGDELFIEVKPLYSLGESAFGSDNSSSSTRTSISNAYFYSYPVYDDGNIDYPYIGKIQVRGLTLQEARNTVIKHFSDYLQGISITVKLANNYINILGEVKSPGRKQLNTEQLNIFEALALAGDLTSYAQRTEIKIIRETDQGPVIKTFDIRKEDIIHSEFYWIMPGDIIYVSRIKGQFFKMDSFNNFLAIFSSSLSLIILTLSVSNLL